ncbi:hypothetical protein M3Y99_00494300 [Aphelenchoides fujianensis]|nr:hypothetical protein M3Y99_00494300 [Aphelenchoides fujianensis]
MDKCARPECGKTVYPMEMLKCLDKIWHKGCFKCTECGMTLNMKNYKGPRPETVLRAVSSSFAIHLLSFLLRHYPKTVATVIADTPEMKRVADNTRYQSQHKYHEQYEKMKGTKIDVVNDPEIARNLANSKMQSNVAYHNELERKQKQEAVRPREDPNAATTTESTESLSAVECGPDLTSTPIASTTPSLIALCDQMQQLQFTSEKEIECIANKENFATTVWRSDAHKANGAEPVKVGSIADFDPVNGQHGSIGGTVPAEKRDTPASTKTTGGAATGGAATGGAETKTGVKKIKKKTAAGFTVKALFDYTASDTDEISFKEGDVIVDCSSVDEGWYIGTHKTTLEKGMLPANYVEKFVEKTGQGRLA